MKLDSESISNKRDYNRNVNKMIMVYLNLCMHNHFGMEIFCPVGCCIYSFTD